MQSFAILRLSVGRIRSQPLLIDYTELLYSPAHDPRLPDDTEAHASINGYRNARNTSVNCKKKNWRFFALCSTSLTPVYAKYNTKWPVGGKP